MTEIYFKNGRWYQRLEWGTTTPISRQEVIDLLQDKIFLLSEEEQEDLLRVSDKETLIKEKFFLLGFSWKDMEDWCLLCYRLGINPLPTLRRHLNDLGVSVGFMYRGGGWASEKDTLVCELATDENGEPAEVSLVFVEGDHNHFIRDNRCVSDKEEEVVEE